MKQWLMMDETGFRSNPVEAIAEYDELLDPEEFAARSTALRREAKALREQATHLCEKAQIEIERSRSSQQRLRSFRGRRDEGPVGD